MQATNGERLRRASAKKKIVVLRLVCEDKGKHGNKISIRPDQSHSQLEAISEKSKFDNLNVQFRFRSISLSQCRISKKINGGNKFIQVCLSIVLHCIFNLKEEGQIRPVK